MEISIIDSGKRVDSETWQFAERRLLFALSKFGSKITRVVLIIAEVNGPQSKIDQQCSVRIKMPRKCDVFISEEGPKLKTCIARCAERAGRTVARVLSRKLDTKRCHRQIVGPRRF
jgi:hypothetical protein